MAGFGFGLARYRRAPTARPASPPALYIPAFKFNDARNALFLARAQGF